MRFDPGSKSDAEFDMNMVPNKNAVSSAPSARAACRATGVMKTTDVSRLRTAVTRATAPIVTRNVPRAPPGARPHHEPRTSKDPFTGGDVSNEEESRHQNERGPCGLESRTTWCITTR